MRWITRSHLHLDRVATSWLILRFIDTDAEFQFVDWSFSPTANGAGEPICFGMPGVVLGSHDENGTAFAKVRRAYSLDDPALARIESIVDAGVRHALGHEPVADQGEEERSLGEALDRLGEGFGIAFDDDDHLANATPLYDGLYALCQARLLPVEVEAAMPKKLPARIAYLREALGRA